MSDEPTLSGPDLAEAPGWVVTDAKGNVVDSGPLTQAQAAFLTGEAPDTDGEQE